MASHQPIEKRLNVRSELSRIRIDPLDSFLNRAFPEQTVAGTRERYEEAYYLYFRAMERMLEQISTVVRYRKGPHYVRKYGGSYGPRQKELAEKWKRLRPFLELDVSTCIIHTRILLDRAVSLARVFLKGSRLPSFNSFNDHKKFFEKNPHTLSEHGEYSRYMREETGWFDVPIKYVRDKFFVHQGPKHLKLFTIGWERDDNLTLTLRTFATDQTSNGEWIRFNPWRMSYDIDNFLTWFGSYGERALSRANNAP
jgi:hypothetical protein